jgi:hypothetical protein
MSIVLDDAERVDPYILNADGSSDCYGVLEILRKRTKWNSLLVRSKIGFLCFNEKDFAPAMTKGNIAALLAIRNIQERLLSHVVPDVDDASRQWCIRPLARGMVAFAVIKPVYEQLLELVLSASKWFPKQGKGNPIRLWGFVKIIEVDI